MQPQCSGHDNAQCLAFGGVPLHSIVGIGWPLRISEYILVIKTLLDNVYVVSCIGEEGDDGHLPVSEIVVREGREVVVTCHNIVGLRHHEEERGRGGFEQRKLALCLSYAPEGQRLITCTTS